MDHSVLIARKEREEYEHTHGKESKIEQKKSERKEEKKKRKEEKE